MFLIKEKRANTYKVKSVGFIQYFWLILTPESVNAQIFLFEHFTFFLLFLSFLLPWSILCVTIHILDQDN